jgi:hypothetical protein
MATTKFTATVTPMVPGKPKAKPKLKPKAIGAGPTIDIVIESLSEKKAVRTIEIPTGARATRSVKVKVAVWQQKADRPKVAFRRTPAIADAPVSLVEAAAADIVIRGGQFIEVIINGRPIHGTITAACELTDDDKPGFFTAAHVVGLDNDVVGRPVFLKHPTLGMLQIGIVRKAVNASRFIDCATIEIKPAPNLTIALERSMLINGTVFSLPGDFQSIGKTGDSVFHGGIETPGRRGTIVKANFSPLQIVNGLTGQPYNPSGSFLQIKPLDHSEFCIHGDSGGPILRKRPNSNDHDLIGILIAVDGDGIGYAHPMGPVGTISGIAAEMDFRPL